MRYETITISISPLMKLPMFIFVVSMFWKSVPGNQSFAVCSANLGHSAVIIVNIVCRIPVVIANADATG